MAKGVYSGPLSSSPWVQDAPPAGTIAYKVLDRQKHTAPYTGSVWPVPRGRPTRWLSLDGKPRLCSWGYHGWLTYERALTEVGVGEPEQVADSRMAIYEMEVGGPYVSDGEKVATLRARLLRVAPVPGWDAVDSTRMLCRICNQTHKRRERLGRSTWDSPIDGHPFAPEDWDTFALRVPTWEQAKEAARLRRTFARKYITGQGGPGSYNPVVPSFHGAFRPWHTGSPTADAAHANECGQCGLPESLHGTGAPMRDKMADVFREFDRWELTLMLIAQQEKHGDVVPPELLPPDPLEMNGL